MVALSASPRTQYTPAFSHGVHHAWIEGDNLDMAFPVPWQQGHTLAEANLAAMWSNYRDHGYRRLLYVNTASVAAPVIEQLTAAMGDAPRVTGVLLTSSDAVAERRLAQREVGGGLGYAVGRSREAARGLEAEAPQEITRVNTDGRTATDVAAEVIRLSGWRSG